MLDELLPVLPLGLACLGEAELRGYLTEEALIREHLNILSNSTVVPDSFFNPFLGLG